MSQDDPSLRQSLIETVQAINRLGINQGTAGNASARAGDGLLITPSGRDYGTLQPEEIVTMDFDGGFRSASPDLRPSSEWRFHRDILRARPEFGAVLHTHGAASTALACLRREIPAFHYMIALAGGTSIRCAPYATFGTQELSRHALAALEGRKACLLANHGLIVAERSLEKALKLAVEVETLAEMYGRACQLGEPTILSEAEMAEVIEKFERGYGVASALQSDDG